ncbi:hypothetical protein ASG89_03105 [Paenibacillus sp. Soil766]|uniref:hypothetical protein n=1 Tax=Paenibacillus sp. Soil766 TaxID=1736404 RepID=UPI00070D473D|nr:hypothetical protein [Paenibacillus sp. Soil766]KRF03762.1 hypothetical protein ASG89_03105 [Paenibacillus sp. Soil766]
MILKLVILLVICVPLLLFDMVNLKNEKPRAKFIYAFLVMVTIYLSSILVCELRWPTLYDAADYLFGTPSRLIVEFLHVTPQ